MIDKFYVRLINLGGYPDLGIARLLLRDVQDAGRNTDKALDLCRCQGTATLKRLTKMRRELQTLESLAYTVIYELERS